MLDTNQVNEDIVDQYIAFSDSEINADISTLYKTPLTELADFETTLAASVDEYNNYVITTDASPFYVGDSIVISDGVHEERHIIIEIIDPVDMNVFETDESIGFAFQAGARVIRVGYPNPIPFISARFSATNIYEKYFMAQSSPAESDYGALFRKEANQSIVDILSGSTILHGQYMAKIFHRLYYILQQHCDSICLRER